MVVGAASRDLTSDDPRGWRLGGAVSYAGLTLARLGVSTRALVGADALASNATELDLLRRAGAEVVLVELASGPVFENVEMASGRRQHCVSAADLLPLASLPPGWGRGTPGGALVLAPIAGELGAGWATAATGGTLVALGWQGLLRHVAATSDVARLAPAAHPFLARADLVVVSEDDLGPAARPSEAVALVRPGATLVITRGERGGSAFTRPATGRSALRTYRAASSRAVIDPTGAGDVFLGALVATAIAGDRLGVENGWSERLGFAAAASSLAIEAPGLAGVPDLAAVRRRLDGRG